jgi:gamma-glutamyl-gamma-aminobutyrate hydrolase PuuD
MKTPIIAVSPSFYEIQNLDRSVIASSYTDKIQKAGGIPIIIPPQMQVGNLIQLLDLVDGLVLSGGYDIDPVLYGEEKHEKTIVQSPRRKANDMGMFEYAWTKKLPILAVCLGMQEANVFLGGDLWQDIPSQLENKKVHCIGDWYNARHDIHLESNCLIREIIGADKANVNSGHHQAIRTVASDLIITASAWDGIIEALEPKDSSRPLLAVQWHPEMEENDTVGLDLFRWLINKVNK